MFCEGITTEQYQKIINIQKKVKLIGFDDEADAGKFKYSYTTLPKIRKELGRILDEEGVGFSQPTTIIDGKQALITIIFDEKGPILQSQSYLEIFNTGDPQAFGKALTYARRYCLTSLLGIVADKDDDVAIPEKDIEYMIQSANDLKSLTVLYKRLEKDQQTKYQESFKKKKIELSGEPLPEVKEVKEEVVKQATIKDSTSK